MYHMTRVSLAALTAFVAAGPVRADIILGLQDTGNGAPGSLDPAWTIQQDPSGGSVPRAATIINPYVGTPPFTWYSGSPVGTGANWIGPSTSAGVAPGVPSGVYQYQLQFNLTGYNPATASFVYQSAADNEVSSATLNGNPIPYDMRPQVGGNQYFTLSQSMTVDSGFVSGMNTLVFDVTNIPDPSPSAFLFIVDSSQISSVPEPSSIALMGIGLLCLIGIGIIRCRKALTLAC